MGCCTARFTCCCTKKSAGEGPGLYIPGKRSCNHKVGEGEPVREKVSSCETTYKHPEGHCSLLVDVTPNST